VYLGPWQKNKDEIQGSFTAFRMTASEIHCVQDDGFGNILHSKMTVPKKEDDSLKKRRIG
jgi:hypothetical protein